MAEQVHFSLADTTIRTTTSTTPVEVTQFTISWANLTGAGFANGDDVIVFAKVIIGGNGATDNVLSEFCVGTAFAGRTIMQSDRSEPARTTDSLSGREIGFLDRRTLVTNENFYFSLMIVTTSTANAEDFCFFIMKLGGLATDDFRYAEATHSGDAPATATDGASVTLPSASGDDWLVFGEVYWGAISTITNEPTSQLSLGGSVVMVQSSEGEDTAEVYGRPLIGYLENAATSAVCTVQYFDPGTATNDVTRTAVFALRMDAFKDHAGHYDADSIAMGGTIEVFVETNSVSLSLTATGKVGWFAQTVGDITVDTHNPYHRVQMDNADIVSALGRRGSAAYDATDQLATSQFGTISMNSGTRLIDVDTAEDTTATAYNYIYHTLVAFSMELAGPPPSTAHRRRSYSKQRFEMKTLLTM